MIKKIIHITIFVCMFTMLMTLSVFAAPATEIVTLNPGETAIPSDEYQFFEVKMEVDGYITIQYEDYDGDGYGYIYFHQKANTNSYRSYSFNELKKTVIIPLNAGTYYLRCEDYARTYYNSVHGDRFSYTFTKADNGSNYCVGKARNLDDDKTITVIQTNKNNYTRWYKVSVSAKQSLTFTTNNSGTASNIYDSNLNSVAYSTRTSNRNGTSYTYKYNKLPKGTYYVNVPKAYYYSEGVTPVLYTMKLTVSGEIVALKKNTISAKDITKTVSANSSTYKIGATAKEKAKLTYKSNNKSIRVDSKGNITVSANYIGKAKITITAAETNTYKKTSKAITVMIRPSSKVEFAKKPKKQIGQNYTTGIYFELKPSTGNPDCRIQIATSSDFDSSKIVFDRTVGYNNSYFVQTNGSSIVTGKSYYIRIMWGKNGVSSGTWTKYDGSITL